MICQQAIALPLNLECPLLAFVTPAADVKQNIARGHYHHSREEFVNRLGVGRLQVVVGWVLQQAAVKESPCQVIHCILHACHSPAYYFGIDVIGKLQQHTPEMSLQ